jgi:hypothetical protein
MRKKPILNLAITFSLCLTLLLFVGSGALSGQAASQPVTNKPISGKTPTNTTTLPTSTPSPNYQQVDKPPAQKLDIPKCDLAGRVVNVRIDYGLNDKIFFQVELKNNGTRKIAKRTNIPIKYRLVNTANNSLVQEREFLVSSDQQDLDPLYWVRMAPEVMVAFSFGRGTAPKKIGDLKLIVDIDPDNTFKEAQRHRGNNRCVASW